jgi:7,8-dihydropterin-6-yl-methyl-4-(beta-D-ribofuranosyl)aminobenzene 5'-phosphate synthase
MIEKRPHRRPEIIAHPHCFCPRPVQPTGDVGCPVDVTRARSSAIVTTTSQPFWLTDNLVFLGEIPRVSGAIPDRNKRRTILMPDGPEPDRLLDDSALAYVAGAGLVIVTGCAHSGILNIIAYAMKVTGATHVHDIIGGFHLLASDHATIDATVAGLPAIRPDTLHPCHCTSLAAKIALADVAQVGEVGIGLQLEY